MRTADEIDVLEMKVRGLERELRDMRMTLRDQFAMHAMTGLLAHQSVTIMRDWANYNAAAAYVAADAMLAVRTKPPTETPT